MTVCSKFTVKMADLLRIQCPCSTLSKEHDKCQPCQPEDTARHIKHICPSFSTIFTQVSWHFFQTWENPNYMYSHLFWAMYNVSFKIDRVNSVWTLESWTWAKSWVAMASLLLHTWLPAPRKRNCLYVCIVYCIFLYQYYQVYALFFLFERARAPRHFLLGKGYPMRKL